jgi:hypothetical protein
MSKNVEISPFHLMALVALHRGITVLPVLNKIMEVILKLRIQPRVLSIQSPPQRGFTEKTSPLNTSFIIEELKRNAKDEKDILITILLDAKSAFDVVNPEHLMRRPYHAGISNKIEVFNGDVFAVKPRCGGL